MSRTIIYAITICDPGFLGEIAFIAIIEVEVISQVSLFSSKTRTSFFVDESRSERWHILVRLKIIK